MKRRIALFAFCLLPFALRGQGNPPPVTAQQLIMPLSVGAPAQASEVSISRAGQPGYGRYYYWVVSNYTIGSSSPAGPFIAPGAPSTLSSSDFFTIAWNDPGAASHDVVAHHIALSADRRVQLRSGDRNHCIERH
jgi:hypothetical protein